MGLTIKRIERLAQPGRYPDGKGLYLQIGKGGAKSWIYRYQRGEKETSMGLGPLHSIGLEQARESARQARLLLMKGVDPLIAARAERSANRAAQTTQMTVKAAIQAYYDEHSEKWSSPKVRARYLACMAEYVTPKIGDLSVADIQVAHVLKIFEQEVSAFRRYPKGKLWVARPKSARTLRGYLQAVLDFCHVRGYRHGENPARWRGYLDKVLVQPQGGGVRHHPAMPFAAVPAFMLKLQAISSVQSAALQFTILTAARSGETLGARWSEIDLDERVWSVPPSRMKTREVHRVPLADAAVDLLRAQPLTLGNDHIFPGFRRGAKLADRALATLLKELEPAYAVHGFRSSFRDWCSERTTFQHHLVEKSLSHRVGSDVERSYARSDLIEMRRALMSDWAAFCTQPVAGGEVVRMRAKKS